MAAAASHAAIAVRSPSSDGGPGAALQLAPSAGHAGTFEAAAQDWQGEVQRKIPRMQALSAASTSTWQKEWCVATHNFLVFFASRTHLVVNKCVLFSAIQGCKSEAHGVFRILLRPVPGTLEEKSRSGIEKEVILKVPEAPKSARPGVGREVDSQKWMDEITRRADAVASSGQKFLAVMSLQEASQLRQKVEEELAEATQRKLFEERERLVACHKRAAGTALVVFIEKTNCSLVRHAFEELALHSRLEAVHLAQKRAAVLRLQRALGRSDTRMVREAYSKWLAFRGSAQAVLKEQQAAARRERILLGLRVLDAFMRDLARADRRLAFAGLRIHSQNAATAAEAAAADGPAQPLAEETSSDARAGSGILVSAEVAFGGHSFAPPPRYAMPKAGVAEDAPNGKAPQQRDPALLVAQRLKIGARLLAVTLRNHEDFLREWALRSLCIHAARRTEAEATELARCSAALNSELRERCWQVPMETVLTGMVRSMRAAQLRRALSAFLTWARPRAAQAGGLKS
eukprot:TRINITY_DN76186_c0_g1_i1.p1 TRINITY_DN76186_c0_g1~~TRINITY_DN76186_c0_g1_i1.p1  ORF type:complete len:516 (-),score=119.87 TRINITY_DN76186_c0_g1_i1:108-1655(-)